MEPVSQLPLSKMEDDNWNLFLSLNLFQIEVQQLNFRLSYNDVKLFLAIAQSLPNLNSLEKREQPFKPREGEVDGRLP